MLFLPLTFPHSLVKLTSLQTCDVSFNAVFCIFHLYIHVLCVYVIFFFFLVGKKRCLILKPKGGNKKSPL